MYMGSKTTTFHGQHIFFVANVVSLNLDIQKR